jgi:hypothetical protein
VRQRNDSELSSGTPFAYVPAEAKVTSIMIQLSRIQKIACVSILGLLLWMRLGSLGQASEFNQDPKLTDASECYSTLISGLPNLCALVLPFENPAMGQLIQFPQGIAPQPMQQRLFSVSLASIKTDWPFTLPSVPGMRTFSASRRAF